VLNMELTELALLENKVDRLIKLVEFFDTENKKLNQQITVASNNPSFIQTRIEQVVKRMKDTVKQLKEEIK
jgi:uncharacterized protein (DUF885 family)